MRYKEFKQQLNEFVIIFKTMQGNNVVGTTEDGQEVSIDVSRYQLDMPQNDEIDKPTIHDKRQPNERSQILRQLTPGTPIEVAISGKLTAK